MGGAGRFSIGGGVELSGQKVHGLGGFGVMGMRVLGCAMFSG